MANKVSALSAMAAGTLAQDTDELYVVDVSAGTAGSLSITPTALFTARNFTTSITVTGASASTIAAGRQGATSPGFQLDASVATCVTGVKITPNAAASGVAVVVISSGTDESATIDAKGAGLLTFNGTATGNVVMGARCLNKLLAVGPKPTDTYGSAITIDVTKSLHVIAGVNGTSATSTLTPSAAGSAGDILTILTAADASGTVTVTFASTFHTSGTQATTASHFSSIVFESDGTRWYEVCRTTNLA